MIVRILGSAAGGGLPQWNCRCANCDAARSNDPNVRPRTQSSVAVSADGVHWYLLNVSADVRAQLLAYPPLNPQSPGQRNSPIAGCLLTDGEIDHVSGLLQLREGCRFGIYSTGIIGRWLVEVFPILKIVGAFADRLWRELSLDAPCELCLPSGQSTGLLVTPFETDRDVPRFVNEPPDQAIGSRIGLIVQDNATQGKLVYAPGVASISANLQAAAKGASAILLDGTFWSEEEPQHAGISSHGARQLGHLPIFGDGGSLSWLGELPAAERWYTHINNTNPILNRASAEYQAVGERGVRVAEDGDMFLV